MNTEELAHLQKSSHLLYSLFLPFFPSRFQATKDLPFIHFKKQINNVKEWKTQQHKPVP